MEYIWSLEHMLDNCESDWADDSPYNKSDMVQQTDHWFMGHIKSRAIHLWQGEQVDGTMFLWGPKPRGLALSYAEYYDEPGDDDESLLGTTQVLELPEAVMAGYRYLTSLKSSPRYMRAGMHSSLFNKGLYM